MQIQVTRIRIEKVTERVPLPPNNKRIDDPTLNMSRQVVEDPGTPGTQDVTFAIAKVNGVETGRLPVANVVIVPARDGVLASGCQARYGGASRRERRHLGRARPVRSRR